MPGFRITLFGGIIPRLADRGLPDNAAQYAMNAKLFSGELRAWGALKELATLAISNAKTVFHYRHLGGDRYLAFPEHTYVVRAPLLNEQLGRLYWAGSTGPMVNTTTRIEASQAAYKLGVPAHTGTFTVVPAGGTAATAETRVYLATLVTNWGEESGPGTTVTVTGNADGSWTVNGLDALVVDTANYPNISHLRLYRTLTSLSGVDFRRVNEWAIGARPASYVDNVTAVALAAKPTLQSLGWSTPPATLRGLVPVAGGFMAGFVGRTVHLCVPYQPHAWPVDFQYAVEDDIVGLGVFGNTIVVCTAGRTYLLTGPSPDAMSLVKMEGVQPCLSARSIVSTSSGVMYASTDGLVLVDGSSNRGQIISRAWVTKDEWMARFPPAQQMASIYQDRYFAFYSSQLGFCIGFDDPVTGFTELQQDGVLSVDLDTLTGQTLVTIGNKVYEWDGDPAGALVYTWRSKPFLIPKPVNFGALQVRGGFIGGSINIPVPPAQGLGGHAMNEKAINSGSPYGAALNGSPDWLALGLAPAPPAPGPEIIVKVYVDGTLRYIGPIDSERVRNLPSGYKGVTYEIELQGASAVFSVALAETKKALEHLP